LSSTSDLTALPTDLEATIVYVYFLHVGVKLMSNNSNRRDGSPFMVSGCHAEALSDPEWVFYSTRERKLN